MSAEDVLVFHGAQEAIFGYMNVMLDEGDHLIAMYPNYQSAYEVANSIPNCTWSKWYIRDNGSNWVVDFDELESLIQPNTKLIAVCSPNNPTGFTFTNEEIKRLTDICKNMTSTSSLTKSIRAWSWMVTSEIGWPITMINALR